LLFLETYAYYPLWLLFVVTCFVFFYVLDGNYAASQG